MNDIYFAENGFDRISTIAQNYDKIFVLTDNHIDRIYSSMLANLFPFCTYKIVIPVGEQNKNIETVTYIWERLLENQAEKAKKIIKEYKPVFSSIDEYIKHKNSLFNLLFTH